MIKCNLKATKKGLEIKDLELEGDTSSLILEAHRISDVFANQMVDSILDNTDLSKGEKELIKTVANFERTRAHGIKVFDGDEKKVDEMINNIVAENMKKMPKEFQENGDIRDFLKLIFK